MQLGIEGQEATELAALEKDLDISSEQAADVLALIDGEIDPSDLEEPGYYYHSPTGNHAIMLAINQTIDGHGVESVALEQDESGYAEWDSPSFDYVNTGDTYNATIVLYEGDFYLTTWGDAYEEWKIEVEEEEEEDW